MRRLQFAGRLMAIAGTLAACGARGEPPDGQAVFRARCARCHTTTDEDRTGPGLGGLYEHGDLPNGNPVTDETLREWITEGGGRMRPQRLSPEELDALLAYLKTLE